VRERRTNVRAARYNRRSSRLRARIDWGTDARVEAGAIPEQIQFALDQLPAARQVKLYNSGSFFDEKAIPRDDWKEIAELVHSFQRVIVECHPARMHRLIV
jgi:uncharacterized Fe-S cluster-containing MiaB family protein